MALELLAETKNNLFFVCLFGVSVFFVGGGGGGVGRYSYSLLVATLLSAVNMPARC